MISTERKLFLLGAATVLLLVGAPVVASVLLGAWWTLWHMWMAVLPQLFRDGPEGFLRPSYWKFVGAWLLVCLIGGVLFGKGAS